MRIRDSALAILAGILLSIQSQWARAKIISFDPPGSVRTNPTSINAEGEITGWYLDSNETDHGFVRAGDGTITTFDVSKDNCGTVAWSINRKGVITGTFSDRHCTWRGFLRKPDGKFVTFNIGGATDVEPLSINDGNAVTGSYNVCSNGCLQEHGFVRAADGAIAKFDPEGSMETAPSSINNAGVVTGSYEDNRNVWHGFVRATDGTITTFDPRNSTGTFSFGINRSGVIAGSYNTSPPLPGYGFLRATSGHITTIDPDGSSDVLVFALNNQDAVTGYYITAAGTSPGFVEKADGEYKSFSPKRAIVTNPESINESGAIAGFYQTENGGPIHGFLRTP